MSKWKDIIGYEGLYQVSDDGQIKSLDREILSGVPNNHKTNFIHGKLRKCSLNKKGYSQVILCKEGKTKIFLVHRLVAKAFIPNPNNLPCVNHKDENKLNNCVDNLEWCTYKYNNEYNNRVQNCKAKISATLKGRKRNYELTDAQRENIRQGAYHGWNTRRNNIKSAITESVEL